MCSCSKKHLIRLVYPVQCEPPHDKTNKMTVRPAKTQISLGIRPVWSESLLSAWRKLGSLTTHWAHSEDFDQTVWMPRLIRVFAGRTVSLFVLSWDGSYVRFMIQFEPHHEKTCLQGFRPGTTQTGMLSYRDQLESWNFGFSKYRYYTIKVVNNKGAVLTARMCRLVCTFVVRIWLKQVFSWCGWIVFGSQSSVRLILVYHMSHVSNKPVNAICEQQRCRSACASTKFQVCS